MAAPQYEPARINDEPIRLPVKDVVQELVALLGSRTVAYLSGLNSTAQVTSWLRGSKPRPATDAVLRTALQASRYISDLKGVGSVAAWFVGTNSLFEFESPASILRGGGSAAQTDVVSAARAFVADCLRDTEPS